MRHNAQPRVAGASTAQFSGAAAGRRQRELGNNLESSMLVVVSGFMLMGLLPLWPWPSSPIGSTGRVGASGPGPLLD